MILGKRWRYWSVLLLIASAIQGITPDNNHLASSTLLEILSPDPADSNSDEGSTADEPGVLALKMVDNFLRRLTDAQLFQGPAPVLLSNRRTSSDHLGLESNRADMPRGNLLICLLCRLIC